jgi:hypothetical protein
MNAMPNLEPDYSNPEDEVIELIRSYNVRYKNNLNQVAPKVVPILAENKHLIYAMTRVFSRWLQERDDEAAGHIVLALAGHEMLARSSSPNDGGDGHASNARKGQMQGAPPPSPHADGKGQSSTASDGQGVCADPSATERDDEAISAEPANPGQAKSASSSLHVRERGGQSSSVGNDHARLASPAREPSAAHIAALGRAKLRLAETVLDTFKVRGKAIGDIRHREMLALIAEGTTETEVLRKIYQTAGANVDPDERIRDFAKPAQVEAAIREARKVSRAA